MRAEGIGVGKSGLVLFILAQLEDKIVPQPQLPKLSAVQIRTRSVVFGPRLQAVAAEQDNFLRILKEAYN